jgi:hypothetical protein
MAYVKLTHDGNITRFVDENDINRLTALRNDLGAVVEMDEKGVLAKRYTAEEVGGSLSRSTKQATVEELFGIAPATKGVNITVPSDENPKK